MIITHYTDFYSFQLTLFSKNKWFPMVIVMLVFICYHEFLMILTHYTDYCSFQFVPFSQTKRFHTDMLIPIYYHDFLMILTYYTDSYSFQFPSFSPNKLVSICSSYEIHVIPIISLQCIHFIIFQPFKTDHSSLTCWVIYIQFIFIRFSS